MRVGEMTLLQRSPSTRTHINAGRPEYIAASNIKKWLITKQVRSTGLACHCELVLSCCPYSNAHAHALTQMNMFRAAKIHEYKVKPLCIDGTHGFWCTETNTFVDHETSFSPPMILRANLRLLAKVMRTRALVFPYAHSATNTQI